MADGYTRAGGEIAVCIAQNGPGITNFVTAVAAAYWNHTPMVVITPETGSNTQGLGGFQETRQLPCFEEITCHQETLSHPTRIAEALSRCFQRARQHGAPVQFNLPRDMFCQVIDTEIPEPILPGRQMGDEAQVEAAARLLSGAAFPVIVAGAGVVLGDAIGDCGKLAEAPRRTGREQLPAQRQLPGQPPAGGGTARLPGLGAGDAHGEEGRRDPGAGHPPQSLQHPAPARHRVLDGAGEDHPGRLEPRHAGAREAHRHRDLRGRPRGCPAAHRRPGRARLRRGGRGAPGGDRHRQVGLAAEARGLGPRGGRPRQHLERARPARRARQDGAAPGAARDPGRAAVRRDGLDRHRQHLRDGQQLPRVRGAAQLPRPRHVRKLRLRLPRDHGSEARPPRAPGGGAGRRRRLRHQPERAPHLQADGHPR